MSYGFTLCRKRNLAAIWFIDTWSMIKSNSPNPGRFHLSANIFKEKCDPYSVIKVSNINAIYTPSTFKSQIKFVALPADTGLLCKVFQQNNVDLLLLTARRPGEILRCVTCIFRNSTRHRSWNSHLGVMIESASTSSPGPSPRWFSKWRIVWRIIIIIIINIYIAQIPCEYVQMRVTNKCYTN